MPTYKNVGGVAPQYMGPDAAAAQKRLGQMLVEGGMSEQPMRHWTQALGSVLQTGVGALNQDMALRDVKEGQAAGNKALAQMLMGGDGSAAMSNPYVADKAMSLSEKRADRGYAEGKEKRDISSKSALAAEAGLKPGTPEFMEYVYGIKPKTGADDPNAVREYQYYMSLPPEQRTEYLRVKRAEKILDLGPEIAIPNPAAPGGAPVATFKKDLAGAEALKELGTAEGKAMAAAGSDLSATDSALDPVESIRTDKNREAGTAIYSPLGNLIPKTPGIAFEKKVEQAKSGAFLTAIQQLRGMGALSNAEGQTATAAVTRMSTAVRDSDFEEALRDYEREIMRGRRKAEKILAERERLLGRGAAPAPGGAPDLKSKYGLE